MLDDFEDDIFGGKFYSIVNIAHRIATDKDIEETTGAWKIHVEHIKEDLTKELRELYDKVKNYIKRGNGTEFHSIIDAFRTVLNHLQDFKETLYKMLQETKPIKDFSKDTEFQKRFKRFKEEFNSYMERLVNYSADLKAELQLDLGKSLVKKVVDLNEL